MLLFFFLYNKEKLDLSAQVELHPKSNASGNQASDDVNNGCVTLPDDQLYEVLDAPLYEELPDEQNFTAMGINVTVGPNSSIKTNCASRQCFLR